MRAAWSVSRIRSVEPYAEALTGVVFVAGLMLLVWKIVPQPVHLGGRRGIGAAVAGVGGRRLGDPVVAGILDVVDHVLELDGHVEVERRLDAARHDLGPCRLGRSADLHRELEGLAILRAGHADRGQAGLVDLGAVAAVADQVDGRRSPSRAGSWRSCPRRRGSR